MKMRHILGTVTIVAIVGGTIYAIKKSKDAQKAQEQEITLEEAKEIVKGQSNFKKHYDESTVVTSDGQLGKISRFNGPVSKDEELSRTYPEIDADKMREVYEEVTRDITTDEVDFTTEGLNDEEFKDDDGIDENIEGPEIEEDDYDIGIFTEEDRVLRYEPSSLDALKQFKRMELAELSRSSETYQTMLRLFDFPFQPVTDGDDVLRTQIIDYRVQFFGFGSKWAQKVTFADVILHYARSAQFNCDESVAYWIEYFIDFNDLWYQYSSSTIENTIKRLNSHQYFNEERQTFGLFGLTSEAMDQAIKIAKRNIDGSVTYEIEFNEFLKSFI